MEATRMPVQDLATERIFPRQVVISIEFAAYLALVVLALVFRFAELDVVPLTDGEAREALAAWRVVYPDAAGGMVLSESPLLFQLHNVSFSLLGGTEFTARLFTALAGVLLVISPLLFIELIGRARAFLLSLLLLFSPVLLAASRFDRPVIWTLLFGLLMLWALWRYSQQRQSAYAILATVILLNIVFLTEPAGFILALILLGAGVFARYMSRESEQDSSSDDTATLLRGWPWQRGLLLAAVTILLVGTGFLVYPAGLSSISGLLAAALQGLITPSQPGAPIFFPLLTSLYYEPLTWAFGLAAIWLLSRRGALTLVERFLIGWLVLGVIASLLYPGAGPEHALWVLIPLTGLASALVVELLAHDEHPLWDTPWWGKWLLALGTAALLAMLSVHLQGIARGLLTAPDESLAQVFQALQRNSINNLMFLLSILLTIGIYFTAASMWGNTVAARGSALGVLIFGLVTALSSGWQVSVTSADNPVELWHVQPTSRETALLRETLVEVAKRETDGVPNVPIYVQAPDDGVVAWLVRDFVNTTFINDISEARTQGVMLLRETAEPPDLGGSYVGQPFVIYTHWSPQGMLLLDYPAWWLQRRTRTIATPVERMILWLRQDIYDGVEGGSG